MSNNTSRGEVFSFEVDEYLLVQTRFVTRGCNKFLPCALNVVKLRKFAFSNSKHSVIQFREKNYCGKWFTNRMCKIEIEFTPIRGVIFL